jgi:hypothetical protein
VQVGLRPVERRFFVRHQEHRLTLRVRRGAGRLAKIERAINGGGVQVRGLRLRPARGGAEDRAELDLGAAREGAVAAVLDALRAIDGVRVSHYSRGAARLLPAGSSGEPDEADCPDGDNAVDDDPEEDNHAGTR